MDAKSFKSSDNPTLEDIMKAVIDRSTQIEQSNGFLMGRPIPATAQTDVKSAGSAA